jgi:hypothetical protein
MIFFRGRIYGDIFNALAYGRGPDFGTNPSGANRSVVYSAFRFFKIFFANGSLISLCRGTASIDPSFGLIQSECEAPSRFK